MSVLPSVEVQIVYCSFVASPNDWNTEPLSETGFVINAAAYGIWLLTSRSRRIENLIVASFFQEFGFCFPDGARCGGHLKTPSMLSLRSVQLRQLQGKTMKYRERSMDCRIKSGNDAVIYS
jgi:hypothetical protein